MSVRVRSRSPRPYHRSGSRARSTVRVITPEEEEEARQARLLVRPRSRSRNRRRAPSRAVSVNSGYRRPISYAETLITEPGPPRNVNPFFGFAPPPPPPPPPPPLPITPITPQYPPNGAWGTPAFHQVGYAIPHVPRGGQPYVPPHPPPIHPVRTQYVTQSYHPAPPPVPPEPPAPPAHPIPQPSYGGPEPYRTSTSHEPPRSDSVIAQGPPPPSPPSPSITNSDQVSTLHSEVAHIYSELEHIKRKQRLQEEAEKQYEDEKAEKERLALREQVKKLQNDLEKERREMAKRANEARKRRKQEAANRKEAERWEKEERDRRERDAGLRAVQEVMQAQERLEIELYETKKQNQELLEEVRAGLHRDALSLQHVPRPGDRLAREDRYDHPPAPDNRVADIPSYPLTPGYSEARPFANRQIYRDGDRPLRRSLPASRLSEGRIPVMRPADEWILPDDHHADFRRAEYRQSSPARFGDIPGKIDYHLDHKFNPITIPPHGELDRFGHDITTPTTTTSKSSEAAGNSTDLSSPALSPDPKLNKALGPGSGTNAGNLKTPKHGESSKIFQATVESEYSSSPGSFQKTEESLSPPTDTGFKDRRREKLAEIAPRIPRRTTESATVTTKVNSSELVVRTRPELTIRGTDYSSRQYHDEPETSITRVTYSKDATVPTLILPLPLLKPDDQQLRRVEGYPPPVIRDRREEYEEERYRLSAIGDGRDGRYDYDNRDDYDDGRDHGYEYVTRR